MEVGNKTYKCNLCSSRFSDITGIQDHLISSHREHLPEAEESEGEDLLDEEEEEGIRRFDGVEREEVLGRRGREVETRGERIEDMMIQDSTLQEEGGIVEQFGHIEQLWLDEDGDGELSEFEIYKGKLRQLRENDSKFSSKKEAYYIMYKQNTENASYQEYNTKIISSMNFIPKVFGQDFNDFTRSLGTFSLGKRTLRKIQGKFGMAVYNYFKFLKWACTLNLVMAVFIFGVLTVSSYIVEEVPLIKHCNESTHMDVNDTSFYFPEYSDQCCSSNYLDQTNQGQLFNTTSAPAFFSSLQIFLQDLFQGSGWMVDSYFYYGKYAPGNKSERFQMDLAYWFIIFSCFLLSLVSTVWSSANSFQQSFKWNKFNNVQYFDLCFCNWDFCLDTIQAVQVKQDVLKNEARTALETDRMQALQDKRTRGQKLNLVLVRVICNLLVLCLLGGFIIGLYYAFIWVPLQLTELKCPTSDEILSEAGEKFDLVIVKCFFIEYLTSIIITVANLALPILFNFIISMEKYSPKADLLVNLMRSITLRIASLVLTIAAQYQLNNCDYACFDEVSNEITNSCSNSTLQACSNSNLDVTGLCKRGLCWENSVGAQYFKLTLLDFIVQLVLMLVDLARSKCCAGNISFDVTKHVLDIVYSQTICWMGLFFAPLLSLVTFIKFVIILFIKIIYIKSVCTPQDSFYQASRISSIFKYFLLLGFWVSVIPLSLFIGYTTPSNSCGPFRYHTEDGYYGVVLDKIKEINWAPAQNILYLLGQMTTLYLIFSGVLLLIYYYYAQATAQGDLCSRIEKELNQISMHKKMLVSRISEETA